MSDQIKDDVQKAGVTEVPEINVLIEHMSSTHNTINSIIYSIKWVHGMCNKNDPTNNSYIVSLQESAKRAVRPLKQKKRSCFN